MLQQQYRSSSSGSSSSVYYSLEVRQIHTLTKYIYIQHIHYSINMHILQLPLILKYLTMHFYSIIYVSVYSVYKGICVYVYIAQYNQNPIYLIPISLLQVIALFHQVAFLVLKRTCKRHLPCYTHKCRSRIARKVLGTYFMEKIPVYCAKRKNSVL